MFKHRFPLSQTIVVIFELAGLVSSSLLQNRLEKMNEERIRPKLKPLKKWVGTVTLHVNIRVVC